MQSYATAIMLVHAFQGIAGTHQPEAKRSRSSPGNPTKNLTKQEMYQLATRCIAYSRAYLARYQESPRQNN